MKNTFSILLLLVFCRAAFAGEITAEPRDVMIARAKKEGTLNAIIVEGDGAPALLQKRFMELFPFAKVKVNRLQIGEIADGFLAALKSPQPYDVIDAGVPTLLPLADNGRFAGYQSPSLSRIRPKYAGLRDARNRWTPFMFAEEATAYNSRLTESPPHSLSDLCDKRFDGQVSYEPVNPTYLYGLWTLLGNAGLKPFFECISRNHPILTRGTVARTMLMIAGDHAVVAHTQLNFGLNALAKATIEGRPEKVPFAAATSMPTFIGAHAAAINTGTANPYLAALWADSTLDDGYQDWIFNQGRGPVIYDETKFGMSPNPIAIRYPTPQQSAAIIDLWIKTVGRS